MFLDASAIVAILGDEDDADLLIGKIEAATQPPVYSPLSAYEATVSFARKKAGARRGDAPIQLSTIEQAAELVESFLAAIGAIEMPITSDVRRDAVFACKTYGKAVGHPAKLNLGDCFAYACARANGLPLLCKGNDFPLTDIERA